MTNDLSHGNLKILIQIKVTLFYFFKTFFESADIAKQGRSTVFSLFINNLQCQLLNITMDKSHLSNFIERITQLES